jgi:hypothetical protein
MSFEKIVESKIKQAMADGEFDDLPNGKKIDLSEYFNTPEDIRLAYSMMKTAGIVPEEVELHNEIVVLKERVSETSDNHEGEKLRKILNDRLLKYNLIVERFKI